MNRWLLVIALWAVSFMPSPAEALGSSPDRTPSSVFDYGYRGLLTGGLVGLGAGYLVARDEGLSGDDWRPLVLGAGIGALSGSVLGLTLGFVDLADDQPGMGNVALRDTLYGAGFGAMLGGITGGLVVIRTHEGEHVAFGAAIGTLAGAGLGLAIGLIEGRRLSSGPDQRHAASLVTTRDAAGELVWTPTFRTSF